MLKDIRNLFLGTAQVRAPKTLARPLNALQYRPTQNHNLDVDFVNAAIMAAQSGDMTPLLAIYRDIEAADTTIQGAIMTRKLAVLARGYTVVAAPNSGEAGERVADQVKGMLDRANTFTDACTWLLHGAIWPVSVVERRWVAGGQYVSHPEFRIVPLELYDYRKRELMIRDVSENGTLLSTIHSPADPRYIVHRGHMMMAPDTWGGPMRALLFWFLFSTQDREWWARYLERYGAPFMVGYFDKNDDESRLNLEAAFSEATRLFGVVATRETQIEIKEAGSQSSASQAFQMFHECAKTEKLLLILGQTLSAKSEALGMGGGAAGLQGAVREDVRLWDAFKLGNTIKADVIKPWMDLNNIQGPVPDIVFGGFSPEQLGTMAVFLKSANDAGLQISDDDLPTVSRMVGVTLERKAAPTPPALPPGGIDPSIALALAVLTPSAVANDSVARDASAGYARLFSDELAPLNKIVATSVTRGELLDRAGAFLAGYRPGRASALMTQVLAAHAANGFAAQSATK